MIPEEFKERIRNIVGEIMELEINSSRFADSILPYFKHEPYNGAQIEVIKNHAKPQLRDDIDKLPDTKDMSDILAQAFRDPVLKMVGNIEGYTTYAEDEMILLESLYDGKECLQDIVHNFPLLLGKEIAATVDYHLEKYEQIIPELNSIYTELNALQYPHHAAKPGKHGNGMGHLGKLPANFPIIGTMLTNAARNDISQINRQLGLTLQGGSQETDILGKIIFNKPFTEDDLSEIERKATKSLSDLWKKNAKGNSISATQAMSIAHALKDPVRKICYIMGQNIDPTATGDDLIECDNTLIDMLPKAQKGLESIVHNYTLLLGNDAPDYIKNNLATYANAAEQIGEIYEKIPDWLKERAHKACADEDTAWEYLEPLNLSDDFKTPEM